MQPNSNNDFKIFCSVGMETGQETEVINRASQYSQATFWFVWRLVYSICFLVSSIFLGHVWLNIISTPRSYSPLNLCNTSGPVTNILGHTLDHCQKQLWQAQIQWGSDIWQVYSLVVVMLCFFMVHVLNHLNCFLLSITLSVINNGMQW